MYSFQTFKKELSRFSRVNWWVYLVYISLIIYIGLYQHNDILSVITTSSLHFIADIFIMMMIYAYTDSKFKEGTYFQIASMLIFTMIKFITGYRTGEWFYLSGDVIYILSAYKNYMNDVNNKTFSILKLRNFIILSLIIFSILFYIEILRPHTVFKNLIQIFQTIGIFTFGISLSIINNERKRYFASVISLTIMVTSSIIETLNSLIINKALHGLEISYSLLPLTVLIYFIKISNKYLV